MAQNEAGSLWISMSAQNGDGVVVELDFACRKWLGYFPHIIHSKVSNGIGTKEWHAPHDTNASRTSVPYYEVIESRASIFFPNICKKYKTKNHG